MAIRPILDTLRELRTGAALNEASEKMNELISGVRTTGKKGSITITVHVEPVKNNPKMVLLRDDISIKKPKLDKEPSLFFTTHESNLQTRDPDQPDLTGLTEVMTDTPTIDDNHEVAIND